MKGSPALGSSKAPLAGLFFLCASAAVAMAQSSPSGGVTAAFDGAVRVGRWAEHRVTLVNDGEALLTGVLETSGFDGDGVEVVHEQRQSDAQVSLAPGARTTVPVYTRVGPFESELRFRLVGSKGVTLWTTSIRLRRGEGSKTHLATQLPIATLGTSIGVKDLAQAVDRHESEAIVDLPLKATEQLPLDPRGYDAIDILAVPTSAASRLHETLDDRRLAALEQWVRSGGTLWLIAGESAEKVLSPESPWRRLVAADFVSVERIRKTGSLEQLTSQPFPLPAGAPDDKLPKMAKVALVDGTAEFVESSTGDERPLIARFPVGLGQACLTTVDLDRAPYDSWAGRPAILRGLFETRAARTRGAPPEFSKRAVRLGFRDLSGQLRASIDRFQSGGHGAFTIVGATIVVYLLLLGPGDYFLLRRFGRQSMHWTWLTLPLLVAATSAMAIWLAQSTRSEQPAIRTFDVCDVDVSTGAARGRSFASVYSPRTDLYDLAVAPTESGATALGDSFAGEAFWMGLPGQALGGLESRTLLPPFRVGYRTSVGATPKVVDLPIQADGSKPLASRWSGRIDCQNIGELRTTAPGRLEGELTNPLSATLRDAWILYDGYYFPIGQPWAPSGAISLENMRPANLEARLRRRVTSEGKEVTNPWNAESLDLARVAEMCFFFEAAGGREFTTLTHRYLGELDLSPLQKQNRAILIGRLDAPLATWSATGGPVATEDALAYARFVIPVRRVVVETPEEKQKKPRPGAVE